MNRTFTLCFSLYPIALPFGYVLIYTFYHYAVPDANSNLTGLSKIQTGSVLTPAFDCKANSEIDVTITLDNAFENIPTNIFVSAMSKSSGITSFDVISAVAISNTQVLIRLFSHYNVNRQGDIVQCRYIAVFS